MKLGISGIGGRMGQRILHLASQDSDCQAVLGLECRGHPLVGEPGAVAIGSDPEGIKTCDCLIEFSTPQATQGHLPYLVKFKKCAVIGTTGLDSRLVAAVRQAAEKIPIVYSPNMSVGVNLLFRLLKESAQALTGYGVNISEAHHIHKKDAPSGTAKKIAQIINEQGFKVRREDILARREDEIVGDHRVVFESDVDKIELFHSAKTRDIFALGAILAAKWVVNKKPGLYSMQDVLFSGGDKA